MIQLILHLIGDYLIQSNWMANNKTSSSLPCFVHCLTYTLPFFLVSHSPVALLLIFGTHFLIDRFRLAKYIVYAKNFFAPPSEYMEWVQFNETFELGMFELKDSYRWENCSKTGYNNNLPDYLAFWLLIIADNTLHLTLNYLALKYL